MGIGISLTYWDRIIIKSAVDIEMYQLVEAFKLALPKSDKPIMATDGAMVRGVLEVNQVQPYKIKQHTINT